VLRAYCCFNAAQTDGAGETVGNAVAMRAAQRRRPRAVDSSAAAPDLAGSERAGVRWEDSGGGVLSVAYASHGSSASAVDMSSLLSARQEPIMRAATLIMMLAVLAGCVSGTSTPQAQPVS
jgi:hypothetical protein